MKGTSGKDVFIVSAIETIRSAMLQAMKDRNAPRKEALSLLLSALKSKAIDKRADLTVEEENAIILREIKQCQETIDTANGREDIISDASFKLAVYREFAPAMMNEEEIRAVIGDVLTAIGIEKPSMKDKGRIMKELMPRVKGKADSGLVNQILSSMMA